MLKHYFILYIECTGGLHNYYSIAQCALHLDRVKCFKNKWNLDWMHIQSRFDSMRIEAN